MTYPVQTSVFFLPFLPFDLLKKRKAAKKRKKTKGTMWGKKREIFV